MDELTAEEQRELRECVERILSKLAPVLEELPTLHRLGEKVPVLRCCMNALRMLVLDPGRFGISCKAK